MASLNLSGWGFGGLWAHDLSKILATALIGSPSSFDSVMDSEATQYATPPSPQTSIVFKLILPFLLLPPKTPRFLWCGWFCVAPALSRFYHSSDGLPRSPSHLRRSQVPTGMRWGL